MRQTLEEAEACILPESTAICSDERNTEVIESGVLFQFLKGMEVATDPSALSLSRLSLSLSSSLLPSPLLVPVSFSLPPTPALCSSSSSLPLTHSSPSPGFSVSRLECRGVSPSHWAQEAPRGVLRTQKRKSPCSQFLYLVQQQLWQPGRAIAGKVLLSSCS